MSDLVPVQRFEERSEFFKCSCSHDAHTVEFTFHPWDPDKDLYLSVHLNLWRGILKRSWYAVKYVLGYRCPFGMYDSWILRKEDAFRLRELIDDYISQTGLVVEGGVVKEPRK